MARAELINVYAVTFLKKCFSFTYFHGNMNLICDSLQMINLNYEQLVQAVANIGYIRYLYEQFKPT